MEKKKEREVGKLWKGYTIAHLIHIIILFVLLGSFALLCFLTHIVLVLSFFPLDDEIRLIFNEQIQNYNTRENEQTANKFQWNLLKEL